MASRTFTRTFYDKSEAQRAYSRARAFTNAVSTNLAESTVYPHSTSRDLPRTLYTLTITEEVMTVPWTPTPFYREAIWAT